METGVSGADPSAQWAVMPECQQRGFFQVAERIRVVIYDRLPGFRDADATQTRPLFARMFDGQRVSNGAPLLVRLLRFLETGRQYSELELAYDHLRRAEGDEREYLPLPRVLLFLLQRRVVLRTDEPPKDAKVDVFIPNEFEDGVFVTPDMLTFIEEGEHFPLVPYVIRNPRAGVTHWMDRTEFLLARYLQQPRDFGDVETYVHTDMGEPADDEAAPRDLVKEYLGPMLNGNLLVFARREWVEEKQRPSVYVKARPVLTYPIAPRSFPASIALIPTLRCNNFCRHCAAFRSDDDQYEDGLGHSAICGLIDEMHTEGLDFLRFTGGEPFMREDILDILEYAAAKYFGILLYTNGNRIDADNIGRISEISAGKDGNFLVHLSLDGGEAGHDWFRRTAGAYRKVVQTMRLFREARVPYYVEMCVHPMMLEELDEAVGVAIRLGARAVLMHPAAAMGRGKGHLADFHLTFAGIKALSEQVARLREKHPGFDLRFSSYELATSSYMPEVCPQPGDEAREDTGKGQHALGCDARPRMGHCTAGLTQLTINHDGEVYPCPNWPGTGLPSMGNVSEQSIGEIWRKEDVWEVCRGGWGFDDIPVCRDCPHGDSCELGKLCRLPSYVWFGTLYGPPPSCVLYWRELGIAAGVIRGFYRTLEDTPRSGFPWDDVLKEAK